MSKKTYVHSPILIKCSDYDSTSQICQNCTCNNFDVSVCAIYQECSAFYYVFQSIESKFKKNGITSEKIDEEFPTLLSVPYIVNGAFICELSLKCILITNNIEFELNKGHCLEYLFYLLPLDIKTELTQILKKESGLSDEEITNSIHYYNNAFVKWRYYFSNLDDNMSHTNFFSILVHTLYEYIYRME